MGRLCWLSVCVLLSGCARQARPQPAYLADPPKRASKTGDAELVWSASGRPADQMPEYPELAAPPSTSGQATVYPPLAPPPVAPANRGPETKPDPTEEIPQAEVPAGGGKTEPRRSPFKPGASLLYESARRENGACEPADLPRACVDAIATREVRAWMTRNRSLLEDPSPSRPGFIDTLRDVSPIVMPAGCEGLTERLDQDPIAVGCWLANHTPLLPHVERAAKRELRAQRTHREPDGWRDTRWGMSAKEVRRSGRVVRLDAYEQTEVAAGPAFRVGSIQAQPIFRFYNGQLVTVLVSVQNRLGGAPLNEFFELRDALARKYRLTTEGWQDNDAPTAEAAAIRDVDLDLADRVELGYGVHRGEDDLVTVLEDEHTRITLRATSAQGHRSTWIEYASRHFWGWHVKADRAVRQAAADKL